MKWIISIMFLAITFTTLHAQEVLIDLGYNPQLLRYKQPESAVQKAILSDTLKLPFMDDFSRQDPYPDPAKWMDQAVFINADYPYNPVTYGVATFDAIRKDGTPYNFGGTSVHGSADTLTSRPIAMDTLKTPGDSALFSFYYQPQGRGNAPETADSLILQFRTPAKEWHNVWSTAGGDTNITFFRKIRFAIDDTAYFKKGFQFRFRNYATLSGNLDHWHIDYVRIYIPQSISDTTEEDIAFTKRSPSLLKNYREMPWKHYLNDPASEMDDSMFVMLRNNSLLLQLVDNDARITNEQGSTVHSFPSSANNQSGLTNFTYRVPVNFTFPDNLKDSALFEVVNSIKFTNDLNRGNDTIREYQRFYNYYAYDDGTVENGYGITATGGKVAYRFTLKQTDTLRAVQMYFNQQINDVSAKTFKLTVWDGNAQPNNILYQKVGVRPTYTDSLNKFHTYLLDTALILNGTFFVGWVQVTSDLLNIGIDRNIFSNDNMFFNTTGNWQNSLLSGSWMIRPVFGDSLVVNTGIDLPGTPASIQRPLVLYPNPAKDVLFFDLPAQHRGSLQVIIYDITGRVASVSGIDNNSIDISPLPQGMYFIRVTALDKSITYTGKFIKEL